ncbi:protein FAM83B [Saccopteryx leptura]|uniref:protein FAM83B n=1 Tax=Saccopteryx leptura TaxID=249018 RepID=UPI00339C5868
MESSSLLSSLNDDCKSDNYIEPHYKEWYRLAIDMLIEHGLEAYQEFLAKERVSDFLAEEEINYILKNAQKVEQSTVHGTDDNSCDDTSSSGTYWPIESDVEAPNLDLGWPYVLTGLSGGTHVELLFHPPRAQLLTIKETIRKMIKEARKVIALVMDMFTDVDIFKEIVEASTRGVSVYILLDESNFNHFLDMTEKQGCQVQRLRNIRVRTVKGQDYLSKSGAKFYGKLEQKFLLVDCQKVMYGSYSYMWSFEKAHLSMVQIITGQLVESFDEEFRTLYARSCVPSSFIQEESARVKHGKALWENGTHQRSVSSLASVCSQRNLLGRQDKMHTLDSSYLKNRGIYTRNEHERYSMRNHGYKPAFGQNFNGPNTIRQYQPSQNENWKRHSYAGEQPETAPYLLLNRALNRAVNPPGNWKKPSDSLSVTSSSRGGCANHHNTPPQSFGNWLAQRKTTHLAERNSNVRRSFNGTDNHVRFLQQRMPTLENTTKSFLRNWRIESYLNDHSEAAPDSNGLALGERFENYGSLENLKANALYTHSRLRPSFVFKPTLPEQQEVNSCTTGSSNSTIIGSQGSDTPKEVPDTPKSVEHSTDKPVLESIPTLPSQSETPKMHTSPVPENHSAASNQTANARTESNNCLYTNLCVKKQIESIKNQENENMLKRRSFPFFDHSKANLDHGNSKHYVYSTLTRNRIRQPEKPKEDMLKSSKSMHNVTNSTEEEEEVIKRVPPTGTATKSVSIAALLDVNKEEPSKELTPKKEVKGSPSFLKKGSQKLRSFLSLTPEKKENLSKSKASPFYRMCSSSDTLVSETEENQNPKKSEPKVDSSPRRKRTSSSNSQGSVHKSKEDVTVSSTQGTHSPSDGSHEMKPSLGPVENKFLERAGDASAPRFNTEQIQYRDSKEINAVAASVRKPVSSRPKPSELIRTQSTDRRIYSRFEPFCKIETSTQPTSNMPNTSMHRPEIKTTVSNSYGRSSPMLNYSTGVYHAYQPSENKFLGFMQKFGNFIHKNK